MDKFTKDEELHKGKTKIVSSVKEDDNLVILQSTDDITAFDDPKNTKNFKGKGICSNKTTCNIFELLKKAGIPVAYQGQLSNDELLALKCDMISLEVIARRFAVGSYLDRHPEFTKPKGTPPHRFDQLKIEFFLKTTKGQLTIDDEIIVEGLDYKNGEDDPFITNPEDPKWNIFHPKKPANDETADLQRIVPKNYILPSNISIAEIEKMTKKVFYVVEAAWLSLGYRYIDFKIEFGIGLDGKLYVADVIDNDSGRLRDADWNELSKQLFRDGKDLKTVKKYYELVTALTENFRVPKQTLVVWRGSTGDSLPKIDKALLLSKGIEVVEVVLSGHKSTQKCLNRLSELHSQYPDGGIIIAKVGRSNGLGPILASHSVWPVISIPADLENFPNDIYSSARMPSNVPMATVWPEGNAVLYALRVLGQKNPLISAMCQEDMESFEN